MGLHKSNYKDIYRYKIIDDVIDLRKLDNIENRST